MNIEHWNEVYFYWPLIKKLWCNCPIHFANIENRDRNYTSPKLHNKVNWRSTSILFRIFSFGLNVDFVGSNLISYITVSFLLTGPQRWFFTFVSISFCLNFEQQWDLGCLNARFHQNEANKVIKVSQQRYSRIIDFEKYQMKQHDL